MMADFDKVCEEVSGGAGDHEEFFNKKFDQLEKLHELYKSVSSISAASQSRLELNKNRTFETFEENRNLAHQRSASFSLTGDDDDDYNDDNDDDNHDNGDDNQG